MQTASFAEEQVESGLFREDLYYRLNGIRLTLPSLRERSDRAELIRNVLGHEQTDHVVELSPEAVEPLMEYHWPGNLRQLRNRPRTASALCRDGVIRGVDPGPELRRALNVDDRLPADEAVIPNTGTRPDLAEGQALVAEPTRHEWNVTKTAAELDMSRNILYRKMRRHDIVPPPGR